MLNCSPTSALLHRSDELFPPLLDTIPAACSNGDVDTDANPNGANPMTATTTTIPAAARAPRILPDLAQSQQAEIDALRAEIEALRSASASRVTFKVTERKLNPKTDKIGGTDGAISIYGLGQFPVTLYWSQWERLLTQADALRAFAGANAHRLATKTAAKA